jgi:hypothetical protein
MTRLNHPSAIVFLIFTLIFSTPVTGAITSEKSTAARNVGGEPAGAIESLGTIRINGRIAQTGAMLWGGELLQAPPIESARVSLNEVGQISLQGGSTVKLVSVLTNREGALSSKTLVADLIAGEAMVKLNERGSARICAGNSIFVFAPGSSAHLIFREGRGRILSPKGGVEETSDWHLFSTASITRNQDGAQVTPGEYKIQPYNFSFGLGGYADIEARSVRYLQFRVTDKDDRPAPDLLLLIFLRNPRGGGSSDAGSINYGATEMRVKTDQNGVVSMRFDAGVAIGASASLEVIIAKNNQTLTANLRIVKPKGFWTLKNAGPVMATILTAAVVVAAAQPFGREIPPRPPVSLSDSVVIP